MASLLYKTDMEGLEKQAWAAAAKGIAQAVGKSFTGLTAKPIGNLMQSVARRMGGFKAKYSSHTGDVLRHKVGKEGFANRLWRAGQKIKYIDNYLGRGLKTTRLQLRNSGHTGLEKVVKWSKPAAGTYFFTGGMVDELTGGDGKGGTSWWAQPSNFVWKLNPGTLAFDGLTNLGTKAYETAQDTAANKAYEASMLTAYGIAKQLANRNRLEYLYGAANPEGYAEALLHNAVDGINKQFANQMTEIGRPDWRPETEIGTYGGDYNWNN